MDSGHLPIDGNADVFFASKWGWKTVLKTCGKRVKSHVT